MHENWLLHWQMLDVLGHELASGMLPEPVPEAWEPFPPEADYLRVLITGFAAFDPRFEAQGLAHNDMGKMCGPGGMPLSEWLGWMRIRGGRLHHSERRFYTFMCGPHPMNKHEGWLWLSAWVRHLEASFGLEPLPRGRVRFLKEMPNPERERRWAPSGGRFAEPIASRRSPPLVQLVPKDFGAE